MNQQFCDILKNDIIENLDVKIRINSDFIHAKEKVLSLKRCILSKGVDVKEVKARALNEHYIQFLMVYINYWSRIKLNKIMPKVIIDIIHNYASFGINYKLSLNNYMKFDKNIVLLKQHHYNYMDCHDYAVIVVTLAIRYGLISKLNIKYSKNKGIIYLRIGRILIYEEQFQYDPKIKIKDLIGSDLESLLRN